MSIHNHVTICVHVRIPLPKPAEACESVQKMFKVSIQSDVTHATAVTTEDGNQGYRVVPTVSG